MAALCFDCFGAAVAVAGSRASGAGGNTRLTIVLEMFLRLLCASIEGQIVRNARRMDGLNDLGRLLRSNHVGHICARKAERLVSEDMMTNAGMTAGHSRSAVQSVSHQHAGTKRGSGDARAQHRDTVG